MYESDATLTPTAFSETSQLALGSGDARLSSRPIQFALKTASRPGAGGSARWRAAASAQGQDLISFAAM